MEEYVQLLTAEMGAQLQLSEQPLQTIFFGGGTPSLVPPQALQRILAVLEQQFGIASDAEISMEADPGTFDAQVPRNGLCLPVRGQAHCLVVSLCIQPTRLVLCSGLTVHAAGCLSLHSSCAWSCLQHLPGMY